MLIRELIGDLTFRTDIANGEDFLVYRLYRKVARIYCIHVQNYYGQSCMS